MKRQIVTGIAVAGTLMTGLIFGAGPASASGHTVLGCPSGASCVYTEAGLNNSSPSYEFFSYGYHNLSNMTGEGAIMDNQTGGTNIGTYWCAGYGGTGTLLGAASGPNNVNGYTLHDGVNLTPVNSLILTRHYSENPPSSCSSVTP